MKTPMELVADFEAAVRAQAVADWATAYGNAEPDRKAPEKLADARRELLKVLPQPAQPALPAAEEPLTQCTLLCPGGNQCIRHSPAHKSGMWSSKEHICGVMECEACKTPKPHPTGC